MGRLQGRFILFTRSFHIAAIELESSQEETSPHRMWFFIERSSNEIHRIIDIPEVAFESCPLKQRPRLVGLEKYRLGKGHSRAIDAVGPETELRHDPRVDRPADRPQASSTRVNTDRFPTDCSASATVSQLH